jgi:hypothetical protein
VPIACGIQTTSTPDEVTLPVAQESGTVSAQGLSPAPPCIPGDRSHVRSIGLVVTSRQKGSVTLRAVILNNETARPVCLLPTWTVKPVTRIDTPPEQAVVYGKPGRYKVTGFVDTGVSRLSATTSIYIE